MRSAPPTAPTPRPRASPICCRPRRGSCCSPSSRHSRSCSNDPAHPFVVVIGGVKVADKIAVIDRFTHLADTILIGGAMAFTFLAADGVDVGASRHEDSDGQADRPPGGGRRARARLRAAAARWTWSSPIGSRPTRRCRPVAVARHPRRLDGPRHRPRDGPPSTASGSPAPARSSGTGRWACSSSSRSPRARSRSPTRWPNSQAVSVVGGGDSVAAVNVAGVADQITHVSTGGGAALELVEGRTLPGVAALEEDA